MSEFLDSLIERKIVTDTTSIEDLQIEAGSSGSSSSLKTFIDFVKGDVEFTDDTPVGVKVTLDKKNTTSVSNSVNNYYLTNMVLSYNIETKIFEWPDIASSPTSVENMDEITVIYLPTTISMEHFKSELINGIVNLLNFDIDFNMLVKNSRYFCKSGTDPEIVYYKDTVNY
jgi:hypothetical protein